WLNRRFGLDVGVGFGLASGSVETVAGGPSTTTDKPSQFGLALHGGVPIALAHGHHFTFEVVPEANFGFTSGTIKTATPPGGNAIPDQELSGLKIDVGSR